MNFTALAFVAGFPLVLLAHTLCPPGGRWALLLAASLAFYALGSPQALPLLAAITLGTYAAARGIDRSRTEAGKNLWCAGALMLCLGCLGWFKYAGFFAETFAAVRGGTTAVRSVLLPAGISFYTFQTLGYVLDVRRGTVQPEKHLGYYALFVCFFPQLVAGPIERTAVLLPQLRDGARRPDARGTVLLLRGFAKKLLLADAIAPFVDAVYAAPGQGTGAEMLAATVLFAGQIYFDFSGYSDIAVGAAALLGVKLSRNFDHPYAACSIREFWRRWHISLTRWFTDYLYIPLGGNRKGKGRQLLNILLVWLATGLWHGADWTFVLWGLLYAALLTAEKLFLLRGLKKLRVLNHIYVLLFVTLGFVLFDADSIRDAATSVCAMFGGGGLPLAGQESLYALRSGAVLLLSAAVGATPLPRRLITAVQQKQAGRAVLAVLEPVGLCLLLAVCTAFLVDGSFNPFLYFRF